MKIEVEHTGPLILFTCQPTKGCNCSRSGVNVHVHLLRNNLSRNISSNRGGQLMPHSEFIELIFYQEGEIQTSV